MSAREYADPAAMRDALERRLRDLHDSTRLPLDRLRKEAALQRLLARIAAVAPPDSWALKGGLAMIARVGVRARATADADATWRADQRQLRAMLDNASEAALADHFEFMIGRGRPIQGEGTEGGFRFPGHRTAGWQSLRQPAYRRQHCPGGSTADREHHAAEPVCLRRCSGRGRPGH
jgi:hypothetical protein